MKLGNFFIPEKRTISIIFFVFIGLVTVVLGLGILNIESDTDITVLLPVNSETEFEREKINRLSKEFYDGQMLFVGVSGNPFSMDKIETLWQMCNDINKLSSVKSTLNPFNFTSFKLLKSGSTGKKNFLIKRSRMSSYPKTQKQLDEFMNEITSNRYLVGTAISYDHKTAGIVIRMDKDAETGEVVKKKTLYMKFLEFAFRKNLGPKKIDRTYFCNQVEEVIKKYEKDFDIYFAGVPLYEAKTKTYVERDIVLLIVPALIMMTLTLFMNFRTTRGTLLPIISILLSIIWTMGIIGWAGYKLNIVAILIPPIIMSVGSSYTLHYLNSYYLNSVLDYKTSRDLVLHSSKYIFPTIITAASTTMIGFASFLTAKILPLKTFGIFIIISIVFTMFFTFFLLSKILEIFHLPKTHKVESVKKDFFSKILDVFRNLVIPFRYLWVGIFILAVVLFCIVIPHLKVQTNPSDFFKNSDKVRQSLIFLQKEFHGTNHYSITLRSVKNKRNFFKSREGLLAAQKVQKYFDENVLIDGYTMIGWNLSPVTLLEDLNMAMEGTRDLPKDEKTIKRFLSFLKASKDDGIKSIINNDFSAITFQVRPDTNNTKEYGIMTEQDLLSLTDRLKTDLDKIAKIDGSFTVEVWGEMLLLARISKYLVKDQAWSLTITLILVFFITLIIFRSPYFAFFSLIPLSFGVLMNFTIMSIFNIALDAATVMIAAISIGIGIDDSIHFILHYKKAINSGMTAQDAVINTLSYTARPILFTSLALILGFLVFLLSSFKPIVFFGGLIAISMFNCTFATLFILPSFFLVSDKIRLFIHRNDKKKA